MVEKKIREEYKLAARQYIRTRSEFNRGRIAGLEAALSWLGVSNDEIQEMYNTSIEEVKELEK